jgi:serine/threonine protein phosphatase PrpC
MKVIPGNAQHIGARASQQDAFGFSALGDEAFEEHGGVMMVLCDGMGGLANGAEASSAAVNAVLAGYQRKLPAEPIPDALNRVIQEAHQAVCRVSSGGEAAGSTVVAAVVCNDRLYWGSLGDTRLYLCRGKDPARQLTEDHNVGTLIKARAVRGESSRRESVTVRDQEALTAYLGSPNPPPNTGRDGIVLEAGDRIVACSDGLYRDLAPDAMAAISRSTDPMTAADLMVQTVLRQELQHQDNLTVALFEVVAPPRRLPARNPAALARTVLAKTLPVTGGFAAGVMFMYLLFPPATIQSVGGPASAQSPPVPVQSIPGDKLEPPRTETPSVEPPGSPPGQGLRGPEAGERRSGASRDRRPRDVRPPSVASSKSKRTVTQAPRPTASFAPRPPMRTIYIAELPGGRN